MSPVKLPENGLGRGDTAEKNAKNSLPSTLGIVVSLSGGDWLGGSERRRLCVTQIPVSAESTAPRLLGA